jgi:hypothetical protein
MNFAIEYVKDGINKVASGFETLEEVEKYINENDLIEVKNPENENECRITQ